MKIHFVTEAKRKEAVLRQHRPGVHTHSLTQLVQDRACHAIAEIGVYKCLNAAKLLSNCAHLLDTYHLVDPWRDYGFQGAKGEQNAGCPLNVDWEELYQRALWLKTQYPAIQVWRLPSVEAAQLFLPESLDLVFIDGDHSYQAVKEDIRAWLPALKKGSILAGHDYYSDWPGVIRAVDELLTEGCLHFLPDVLWYIEV